MATLLYRHHRALACSQCVSPAALRGSILQGPLTKLYSTQYSSRQVQRQTAVQQPFIRHAAPAFRSSSLQNNKRFVILSVALALCNLITQHSVHVLALLRPLHTTPSRSNTSQQKPKDKVQSETPVKDRLTERLADARERSKNVTIRVKTSLTNLTPHENIYNLPNLLTVTRLFAAPLTAYLVLHDQHSWALAVFAYAGVTDLIDGWMARKWKLQTVAGSVIDPMADKALMIIVTVTLALKGALPAYLATLILGRDASLALAAIWYRYASLPSPRTFTRYWDFSLPSAEVHPTTVSKYNTFLQLVLIGSTLALPVITADNHHLGVLHDMGLGNVDIHRAMLYLQILVAGTTAWSGLSYAFLKNAVTILGSNEKLKARQGAIGRAIIGVSFGSIVLAASYLALEHSKQEESSRSAQAS